MVFPIGSSSPKYFLAVVCVRTNSFGPLRTFLASPFNNLNPYISRKAGSAKMKLSSKYSSSPHFRTGTWPQLEGRKIHAAFVICGKSFIKFFLTGKGTVADFDKIGRASCRERGY